MTACPIRCWMRFSRNWSRTKVRSPIAWRWALTGPWCARLKSLLYGAEWKRFQSAPGTRLSRRAFWLDALLVPLRTDTVGRDEIQNLSPTSTGDALVSAPGITPVGGGPFGVRPRLRGLDSTRLLVLVDGERLNNARTATDRAGTEVGLVDLDSDREPRGGRAAPARCSTAPTRWPAPSTSSRTSPRSATGFG